MGGTHLVAYVQRVIGYALTGDTREQIVAVCWGPAGATARTRCSRPIQRIVGELAHATPFDSFMRSRDKGVRNDLPRLHRSRLVVASESSEGSHLDEATVKLISGGSQVPARFLYGEFFEYVPRFKLFLITNHKPVVDGSDDDDHADPQAATEVSVLRAAFKAHCERYETPPRWPA